MNTGNSVWTWEVLLDDEHLSKSSSLGPRATIKWVVLARAMSAPEVVKGSGQDRYSVQFSLSLVSDPLQTHEPQHTRPPCPSPTLGVHPKPCPSSQRCHPTISSSVCPLLLLPLIFPSIRVFSDESALHSRWSKYWSFSFNISPSNEHPGLISFRIDWLDLLALQETLKSLL